MEVIEKISFHGLNDWKLHIFIVEGILKQKFWEDQQDQYKCHNGITKCLLLESNQGGIEKMLL